jgi:RNA polymerase sigma factor (sigma-70 family)
MKASGHVEDPVVALQRVYPPLLGMATSLVGPSHAEDVVQEALVEVLARYPRFAGLESPLAYSKTVVARLAYRRWRRREPAATAPEGLAAAGRRDFTDDVILRRIMLAALERLPRRQRTCVYLRYIEGLDDAQIGRVLGCRPVTVRSQIARALRKLGPLLVKEGISHG